MGVKEKVKETKKRGREKEQRDREARGSESMMGGGRQRVIKNSESGKEQKVSLQYRFHSNCLNITLGQIKSDN